VDMAGFQPSIFWLVNSQATVRSQAPSLLPGLFKCQTFGPITSKTFLHTVQGRGLWKNSHIEVKAVYTQVF
jgi:hypothetical protein